MAAEGCRPIRTGDTRTGHHGRRAEAASYDMFIPQATVMSAAPQGLFTKFTGGELPFVLLVGGA